MIRKLQNKAIGIGTYAGIPLKIHWSFGFLVLFIMYTSFDNQLDIVTSLAFGFYIMIVFLCVTLHEYGHALMARRFGVYTGEIILTPIGGIARMGQISEYPKHEFLIALAGPLVNVVIAIILSVIIYFGFDGVFLPTTDDYSLFTDPSDLLRLILLMNLVLSMFNLIPAFPMDGGRVLRALIAMRTGMYKATLIATIIGMFLALGFIIVGIYYTHPTLSFIGVFIFYMAFKERKIVVIKHKRMLEVK